GGSVAPAAGGGSAPPTRSVGADGAPARSAGVPASRVTKTGGASSSAATRTNVAALHASAASAAACSSSEPARLAVKRLRASRSSGVASGGGAPGSKLGRTIRRRGDVDLRRCSIVLARSKRLGAGARALTTPRSSAGPPDGVACPIPFRAERSPHAPPHPHEAPDRDRIPRGLRAGRARRGASAGRQADRYGDGDRRRGRHPLGVGEPRPGGADPALRQEVALLRPREPQGREAGGDRAGQRRHRRLRGRRRRRAAARSFPAGVAGGTERGGLRYQDV